MASSKTPIAEELAKKQKEISVSEFFEKNKHILGFDSSTRSLITAVKEAVDNALDACEEASILPEIDVAVRRLAEDEYEVAVEDNGPGIVKGQLANVFGRLLYGSRFHAIRQTRGQQGIGISAVVMYAQLTTGNPAAIESKIGPGYPAVKVHLTLDTKKNRAEIVKEELVHWEKPTGTRITVKMEAKYQRGAQSVLEYLRGTAIVNPHAKITFKDPDGETVTFDRATDKLPAPTQEIKPHPEGIELGRLLAMARNTEAQKLVSFFVTEFSRVGYTTARAICKVAGVDEEARPKKLELEQAKALLAAVKKVKIMAPPTDCLSPIGELQIKKGLKRSFPNAEFIATTTRPANVHSGHPFVVEAGLVYGGPEMSVEEPVRILRFANRVPLLYQRGGCGTTHAVEEIDWRRYDLEQRGGKGIPIGPAVVLVHVASTNVPFTSEAKEAVADIDVIQSEIMLAIRDCARSMSAHIRKTKKYSRMREKEELIRKLLPKIAEKSAKILGRPPIDVEPIVARIMNHLMVTTSTEYVKTDRRIDVSARLTNYTTFGKTFTLKAVVPKEAKVDGVEPSPESIEEGVITWRVKRIPTTETRLVKFRLVGLDKDDYTEPELYVGDIDEELVVGAEPWEPGKTKYKGAAEEEEEEEAAAPAPKAQKDEESPKRLKKGKIVEEE
ncbi:MAG: DNA topoisomerase VI subunit B [Methanobacteriota archaeon]